MLKDIFKISVGVALAPIILPLLFLGGMIALLCIAFFVSQVGFAITLFLKFVMFVVYATMIFGLAYAVFLGIFCLFFKPKPLTRY